MSSEGLITMSVTWGIIFLLIVFCVWRLERRHW